MNLANLPVLAIWTVKTKVTFCYLKGYPVLKLMSLLHVKISPNVPRNTGEMFFDNIFCFRSLRISSLTTIPVQCTWMSSWSVYYQSFDNVDTITVLYLGSFELMEPGLLVLASKCDQLLIDNAIKR